MRRRRRIQRHTNHERWLVSYADFITLLFAFFVVMYSAAQLDKRRAGQLATAIQTAFQQYGSLPPHPADVGGLAAHGVPSNLPVGNTEPDDFNLLRKRVEDALAEEIATGEVGVRVTSEGLVISLREVGFFDTGSAELRPSSRPAFDRLAAVLRSANSELRIEGHTDNVPIHNARFSSNWDLSTARATATIRLLMTKYNFAPERLAASGYAEFRPIANNATAEGRSTNRRVDIVVPRKPLSR
ncbi:MAG TPA: flagellar motor protein MotB [Terriglobales bacterium]|nr:flagellar motor protein MotB [Terriglobales bacterium]